MTKISCNFNFTQAIFDNQIFIILIFQMQKSSHDPQPERFEVYIPTKDGTGFTLKGGHFMYKFDSYGGWKDQYGNYYNRDSKPDQEPAQGAYTPQELSEDQQDYDEYQKQYGPSNIDDDYQDDHVDRDYLRNMSKIAQNVGLLATFPSKMPLRVYFYLKSNIFTAEQLYNHFSVKCKGIINVICKFGQEGYFVVQSTDDAERIIRCEGQLVGKFPIEFSLQTVEELFMQPLAEYQLKPIKKKTIESAQKLVQQKKQKKFFPKNDKFQAKKDQNLNKQKPEKQERQKNKQEQIKKTKQAAEQFAIYSFDINKFKKKQDFKQFMDSLHLQLEKDYKNARNLTRKQDGIKYGLVQMLPSSMKKANNKKFKGESIQFKPAK